MKLPATILLSLILACVVRGQVKMWDTSWGYSHHGDVVVFRFYIGNNPPCPFPTFQCMQREWKPVEKDWFKNWLDIQNGGIPLMAIKNKL